MIHSILLQIQSSPVDTVNHAAAAVANVPAPPKQDVTTLMGMLQESWMIMLPLFILLLLAVYFSIERLVVISKAGKVDRNFMNNIRDYLLSGKTDSAKQLCVSQPSPVARVIGKGISRLGKPTRDISEAMEGAGKNEMARVEKNLHFIRLVAYIAPMIGFIGTIIGVITIFRDVGLSGDISIKGVSNGLYIKMFSSAAGLLVGVFSFLFYHILNTMADGVASKIEHSTLEFLDVLNEPGK